MRCQDNVIYLSIIFRCFQILQLAENVTGHLNESQAIESFKNRLADRSQYYNKQPFPQNESFAEAKKNCHGIAKAKKFCPKRWEALQIWFDEEAKVLQYLREINMDTVNKTYAAKYLDSKANFLTLICIFILEFQLKMLS